MNVPVNGLGQEAVSFAPDFARQHGCAWFDRPEPASRGGKIASRASVFTGGWFAVGADTPFRFEHWRDLSDGVVWWTNLTQPEIWSLGQWRRFKAGDTFGVDWRTLMDEWGLATDPKSEGAPTSVHRGSELWARMGYWLSLWSAEHSPGAPWTWGDGSLPEVLAQRWDWATLIPEEPQPILQAAYLERVAQDIPSSFWQGHRRVRLTLPRLAHVRRVWGHRIPKGPWTPILAGEWPSSLTGRAAWADQQVSPLLLRAEDIAWSTEGEEQGRLWLGQRGCRFVGAEREPIWLTGEEVSRVAAWGAPVITQGYRAQGWITEPVPTGWPLGEDDPLAVHAPMPGLLGWAAFVAAATPNRDPTRRHKTSVTARALWWRSAERQMAFEAAWRLHKQGIAIAEYGGGQVVVIMDPHQDPAWLAAAVRGAGLVVPPALASHLARTASADVADPVDVAHWLRAQSDVETLWNLDRLVAPWPGPLAEVKGVLSGAAQGLMALTAADTDETWVAGWKEVLAQQAKISVDRVKRQAKRNL